MSDWQLLDTDAWTDFLSRYEGQLLRAGGPFCPVHCEAFMWCRRSEPFISVPVNREGPKSWCADGVYGTTTKQFTQIYLKRADHITIAADSERTTWHLYILEEGWRNG